MSIPWWQNPRDPNVWQVFPRDDLSGNQCLAAIRPRSDGSGQWEGAVRAHAGNRFDGVKFHDAPSREAAMGICGRLLRDHWSNWL